MTGTTRRFCETLVVAFPEVEELLANHISDYDELLPNVFLAEVTRYLLGDGNGRCRIVEYLNSELESGQPAVQNLIAVSFVENLETREELDRVIDGVEAPQIVAEWDRQRLT